jgi:hypothetical protein
MFLEQMLIRMVLWILRLLMLVLVVGCRRRLVLGNKMEITRVGWIELEIELLIIKTMLH